MKKIQFSLEDQYLWKDLEIHENKSIKGFQVKCNLILIEIILI